MGNKPSARSQPQTMVAFVDHAQQTAGGRGDKTQWPDHESLAMEKDSIEKS